MKLHANAALTLRQRGRMVRLVVEEGWSMRAAAAEFKTSSKTCSKWVARFREASECGLMDRSSACARVANRTDERRIAVIAALRRLRFTGPEIAGMLDMADGTVRWHLHEARRTLRETLRGTRRAAVGDTAGRMP